MEITVKQNPKRPNHAIFLFLVCAALALNSCSTQSGQPPQRNEPDKPASQPVLATNQPGASPTLNETATNLSIQSAKLTLEIETFGSENLEGMTMSHGPFHISIPLEPGLTGLTGHGKGILRETCTGVVTGERTSEQTLDVAAIGQDPIQFTIKWTDTFVSQTGECFANIPQIETKGDSVFELPAKDGAIRKLDHPSDIGEGYEMYTLRMEADN
jgi:hypothetical protein